MLTRISRAFSVGAAVGALLVVLGFAPAAEAAPVQDTQAIICTGQRIWHSSKSEVASSYVDHPDSPPRLIYRGYWSSGYYATYIYRKLGYRLRLWRQDTDQTMTWTSTESIGYVPMPTWAKPCSGTAITLHFVHFT
jgi:hypothetical protein